MEQQQVKKKQAKIRKAREELHANKITIEEFSHRVKAIMDGKA